MFDKKKNIGLLLLALFIILLILYWKDFYTGIVEGINKYSNQID